MTKDERPDGRNRDTDSDGQPDHLDGDDDGDTLPTRDERPNLQNRDTDSDGTPDHLDKDDDNDGIPTKTEIEDARRFGLPDDVDGDGAKNWLDRDSDGDGLLDSTEPNDLANGNNVPDYLEVSGGLLGGGTGADCSIGAQPGLGSTWIPTRLAACDPGPRGPHS